MWGESERAECKMVTNDPSERQSVQVRLTLSGNVKLQLDRYVFTMAPNDYETFVAYLNQTLPLVLDHSREDDAPTRLRLIEGGRG